MLLLVIAAAVRVTRPVLKATEEVNYYTAEGSKGLVNTFLDRLHRHVSLAMGCCWVRCGWVSLG